MARYLQTAKRYENLPGQLLDLVPDGDKQQAAEMIARLVNAGMVGCPRPPQSTVRLNYVRAVCKDLPVRLDLVDRRVNPDNPDDTRTYKALVVTPTTGR